ncbi:hypothetical protein GCM10010503_55450 [Streptomyces lucensis JCM 4490]|uniref:Uncharacterized protein n=1 Tax=Streptomyces lucensis JCM 4490 TaxID=1306176 RepID=A0A918JCK6_9ACTN|nr:hypothetical protein GCM10010503_55450 [Streptomyces lucensis JCM 4490]
MFTCSPKTSNAAIQRSPVREGREGLAVGGEDPADFAPDPVGGVRNARVVAVVIESPAAEGSLGA